MIELKNDELYTTAELASWLGIGKGQVSALRARGDFVPGIKFGRIVYTSRAAAESWLLGNDTPLADQQTGVVA